MELLETSVTCPYCWETLQILVDPSEAGSEYIEDCQVCCRPIVMQLDISGEQVTALREDD